MIEIPESGPSAGFSLIGGGWQGFKLKRTVNEGLLEAQVLRFSDTGSEAVVRREKAGLIGP